MSSVEIKNIENKRKLSKIKAFAVPCLLLNWLAVFISVWAMFSGNGFMSFAEEGGTLFIGFFAVLFLLVMIIMGLVRIKTCINIYKLDGSTDFITLGMAYLDRIGETILLFMGMTVGILLFGTLFGEPEAYSSKVWAVVLAMLAFAHLFPSIYWKIAYNNKFSLSFVLDWLVDLVKIGLVVALIIAVKNFPIREVFTEKGFANLSAALHWPIGVNRKFAALPLEYARVIPQLVFFLVLYFMWIEDLDDLTEKKAKKAMIWGIILMIIDLVLFMFIPSTFSIMGNFGRWFEQARQGWIPVILLLIAIQVSVKFPSGKDIYDDLRQVMTKKELKAATGKIQTEEALQKDEQPIEDTIQQ